MPEMDKRKDLELDGQAEGIAEDIPAARTVKKAPEQAADPVKKAAPKPAVKKTAAGPQSEGDRKPAAKKPAAKKTQEGGSRETGKTEKTAAKKSVPAAEFKKTVRQTEIREEAAESEYEEKQPGVLEQMMTRINEIRANRPKKKLLSEKALQRRRRRRRRLIWKLVRRTLLCLFTALLVAVFGVYMVLFTVFNGPSPTAADLLVNTLLETSALKFVPRIYYTEEQVQEIIARNSVEVPDEATDTDMVVIDRTPKTETGSGEAAEQDIELVNVTGATYRGYMMIVKDPSRVKLAVCDPEFDSDYGKFLDEMANDEGAVAAINAGGFEDVGGSGRGGKPLGIVVKDGKVLNSRTDSNCCIVIGFNQEDKLIVGKMDAEEAVEAGLRDAASFDTILVLNGEPAKIKGTSSGLNPRTAIGQRADGAVLLLVIDGRQVNSLGASMADLVDVMMQFGAVNAANLDGGSSSKMYYQGEFVNDGVALTGSRRLPTAFIVK